MPFLFQVLVQWQRVDSKHRGCEFDYCTCRIKNAIGEEGSEKAPLEIQFRRKRLRALSLVSTMLKIEYAM